MHLTNPERTTPFVTEHGEIVRELLGSAVGGGSQHSLAQITLPPGKAALKHYHPIVEESYFILTGQGRMIVDGEEKMLSAGDTVAITPNAIHQIFNDSAADLIFLAICAPPWTPDCSVFMD
jgi:mannose-6-phosphate isomerase-like protein (cupin superfamily)